MNAELSRVEFRPVWAGRETQVCQVLVDGREAFWERTHFPYSILKQPTVEYIVEANIKTEADAVAWLKNNNLEGKATPCPQHYGDGWDLTTEELAVAVNIWDALKVK